MGKKSIVRNSIFNVVYKGFTALFPLLTTTYIARVLLPDGVGKVAYANTIVSYFVTIAALGLPNYGVKAIAQNDTSHKDRGKTFQELFIINFVSTLICIFTYYLLVNSVAHFMNRRMLFNVMGILLILNIFNIDWFFQGIEEYSYIATRSIIIKIISFVTMLIFVKTRNDYLIYALILCLATSGNYILNAIVLKKYIKFQRVKLSFKKHLRPVFILLASTLATEIYTMLDTVMIEYYHGEVYVGYYSNVVKIVRMIYTVTIAMVATFYPRISQYIERKDFDSSNSLLNKGIKILLIFSLPFWIGLMLTSKNVVLILFGQEYAASITTLRLMSVLIVVFSVAYFLGHLILMASGNENKILVATVCGAIVNAVLNIILIPIFKHNGAAFASVFAEIIVTIVLIFYGKKHFSVKLTQNFWRSEIYALLVLLISICLIQRYSPGVITQFVLCVLVGGTGYFFTLLLTNNELFTEFTEFIRRRHC